jgi:hypothetical protein
MRQIVLLELVDPLQALASDLHFQLEGRSCTRLHLQRAVVKECGPVIFSRHNRPISARSGGIIQSSTTHGVQRFPLRGTLLVKSFERNSRTKFVPTRPARPMAALVKTRFAPRFALG